MLVIWVHSHMYSKSWFLRPFRIATKIDFTCLVEPDFLDLQFSFQNNILMGFRPVFKYENSYFIAARLMGIKQKKFFSFVLPCPGTKYCMNFKSLNVAYSFIRSWKGITCLTAKSFVPSRLWWVIISLAASWRLHLQWWCWSRIPPCRAAFVKSTSDWQYLWHGRRGETQSAGCPVHPADHLCNCPRLCGRWLWSVRDHYCLMLFFAWCLCKSSIQKGREKMSCVRMNSKDITTFYIYPSLLNAYHYFSVPLVKKTKSVRCEWYKPLCWWNVIDTCSLFY